MSRHLSCKTAARRVFLGASGWRHREWGGIFYPEDLPPEWMLAYYNTHFSCVWLPRDTWAQVTPEAAWQWLEDTLAGFRFILEEPIRPMVARCAAVLDILAPRTGLVCPADHPDLIWFDTGTEARRLAEDIQAGASREAPLFLLSQDGDLGALQRAGTLLGLLGL